MIVALSFFLFSFGAFFVLEMSTLEIRCGCASLSEQVPGGEEPVPVGASSPGAGAPEEGQSQRLTQPPKIRS